MVARSIDREMILTDPIAAIEAYSGCATIAFDTETSGLDRYADEVMVVSMASPNLPPAVLHVAGRMPDGLIDLLNQKLLIGHNITSFDIPFLAKYGYDVLGSHGWIDTMITEQLCLTTLRRDVGKSLAATAKRRVGIELDKDVDHAGWTAASLNDRQLQYAALDVLYLHKIWAAQETRLRELKLDQAHRNEMDAQRATAMITVNGMPIVLDDVRHHVVEVSDEMVEVKAGLEAIAARTFNPTSHVQVKKLFEEEFGMKLKSTDVETMHHLSGQPGRVGELASEIQEFRKLKKSSMYNEDWIRKHVSSDGRVRSSYWQLGTDTGRYSCSDPNLQQWPRALRELIGYPDESDRLIMSVDYSQIEILIAAILIKEPELAKAVIEGDVHMFVASLAFKTPAEQIDKRHRSMAKAASFTLLFAGGIPGIIRSALNSGEEITHETAEDVRTKFFAAFPKVKSYINGTWDLVNSNKSAGTSVNVRIPGGPVRSLRENDLTASTVINTLVQGSAAVGLKKALTKICKNGLGKFLCATVHDEVVLDVPVYGASEILKEVEVCMQEGMLETIGVRPKVGSTLGLRWGKQTTDRRIHDRWMR
jgi:DNA polymerase I-like protein with 3'-5' exonuclease and polymerase domains